MALPAPRDDGDDAGKRVHVAGINHFRRRMRVAQRPAERDINGAVGEEHGAVVSASGDVHLHRNLIGMRELNDFVHQFARHDIRLIHRADGKALAELGVGEALGFKRRIGADQSVHGEDVIRRTAFGCEAFGQRARADQTYFLARGPDEGDVAVFERD